MKDKSKVCGLWEQVFFSADQSDPDISPNAAALGDDCTAAALLANRMSVRTQAALIRMLLGRSQRSDPNKLQVADRSEAIVRAREAGQGTSTTQGA